MLNPIEWYQDLEKSRKIRVGSMVGVLVLLLLIGAFMGMRSCQRGAEINAARIPSREVDAISQVREAMFLVSTALGGDAPAASVEEALKQATTTGKGIKKSVVNGEPLKFNPDPKQWMAGKGGPQQGLALVVGPAPKSAAARNVKWIGIGIGGMPIEFVAGQEPEWLGTAVTGPKD